MKTAMASIGSRFQWAFQPRAVVLCYHSIHPARGFRSATPELFDKHLRWLKEQCDVVPLQKLLHPMVWERTHSRPKVAITFDDGYLDNYEYAFPLLMKHGLSATFFVTVGLLERDPRVIELFQILRQAGTEETESMTWQQVREMMKVGMELGSHTYSHVNLASLGRPQLEWELIQAKELMENRIGERVKGLAYPFGKPRRHFNESTLSIVQEVGYQYAVAVLSRGLLRRDSQWILPRFFVTNDDISMLSAKIKGTWDWLGYFQEFSPSWMARLISPEDSRV